MTRAIAVMIAVFAALQGCHPRASTPVLVTPPSAPVDAPPVDTELDEAPVSLKLEQLQDEPIATIGHGGFFDRTGRQIPITRAFVGYAQRYYRDQMAAALKGKSKAEFSAFKEATAPDNGKEADQQDQLLLRHEQLEWLLATLPEGPYKQEVLPKIRALRYALNWVVPEKRDLNKPLELETFSPPDAVRKRLDALRLERPKGPIIAKLVTGASGLAYINECIARGVPIPPSINVMDQVNGTAGWKTQGMIPLSTLFIEKTNPAELRSWKSSSPEGMCYALPRFADAAKTTVLLDGVICMGKQSSAVCFWDNQMGGAGFSFGSTEVIPIGVPSTPGGRYQAGGAELVGGTGGICTGCHAGENPYIVHPKADLDPGAGIKLWESLRNAPESLPSFSVNRYMPLVGASWPQNTLSQAGSTLPGACAGCHVKGSAGRFPFLTNTLPGYCGTVLAQGITLTMPPPPAVPGSAAGAANIWKDSFCDFPPQMNAADSGDPHLTTLNGVHYDFQAAGEFTLIRNLDTAFEVQVRQTPVLTTFGPVADPYSGLSQCVSVNTAVALRIGKRRLSYESKNQAFAKQGELTWYLDNHPVPSTTAIDIDGVKIRREGERGPVEILLAGGQTRIIVNPVFWSNQGVWYLDVTVLGTTAREGIIGPVLSGEWLPRPPSGKSFGPMPASLGTRHAILNQKFADAWRVTKTSSLFTYPSGSTTDDFTDRNWPAGPGQPCTATTVQGVPLVRERRPDLGQVYCQGIKDPEIFRDCVFDVETMGGDKAIADAHKIAEALLPH